MDSGIAGALNATTPLWTLALAFLVRQSSRLNALQVLGLVLGFLGSLLIFTPWDAGSVDTLGALFCLLAALSYGISYLYMSKYLTPKNLTPTVFSTSQLIASSVLTALTLPLDTARSAEVVMGAMAILGVLGTGLAYIINYALIRTEGPVGASVVTYRASGIGGVRRRITERVGTTAVPTWCGRDPGGRVDRADAQPKTAMPNGLRVNDIEVPLATSSGRTRLSAELNRSGSASRCACCIREASHS